MLLEKSDEDAENSETGNTPLWAAISGGHLEAAAALLEGGADVNCACECGALCGEGDPPVDAFKPTVHSFIQARAGPPLCTVRLLPTGRICWICSWRAGPWQTRWTRPATRRCTGQPALVQGQQSQYSWITGPM